MLFGIDKSAFNSPSLVSTWPLRPPTVVGEQHHLAFKGFSVWSNW
jgi:hypothetical protein